MSRTPPSLRLALAMRGGVSLAVWIGGAVQEIDRLRRDTALVDPPSTVASLARALGYRQVELDVLSGASAGGLNAVMLATAMVTGNTVDQLRQVWLDDADLDRLVLQPSRTPALSVLDANFFGTKLADRLGALSQTSTTTVDRVDVFLSVTSVVPTDDAVTNDPRAPVKEQRIDGVIRLRHRTGMQSDFVSGDAEAQRRLTKELAIAAQSTASFPFAFPPLRIGPEVLREQLEIRPRRPDPLFLYDGGVVDNMPVGKAAQAIQLAPADGPTERVLLYLHPSPGVTAEGAKAKVNAARESMRDRGARPLDVLMSALKSLRTKSLVDDLRALDEHNASVEAHLIDRTRILSFLPLPSAVGQRAAPALDAERLVDLLHHPAEHIGALERSQASARARDRAPVLDHPSADLLRDLIEAVTHRLAAHAAAVPPSTSAPSLSVGSVRPWGPIIRAASLLIEWSRWLETSDDADVVAQVGSLKRELYGAREAGLRDAAELNLETLDAIAAAGVFTGLDIAQVLVSTRLDVLDTRMTSVDALWQQLGDHASKLHSLTDSTVLAVDDPALFVIAHLVAVGARAGNACGALDDIDRALLPVHRSAPSGSLDRIRYITIGGTADSPLATSCTAPVGSSTPRLHFTSPRAAANGGLEPGSKLAGNQFHNFAAFFERRWRASDWMWGQMDAAATLIDMLLDPRRLRSCRLEATEVEAVMTRPLSVGAGVSPAFETELNDAVEALWTDEARAAVRAELAAVDVADAPPPVTRWVLLARRHLEVVAEELSRPAAENPAGVDPAPTLAASMSAWDRAPRRLSALWGTRRLTGLGMQAAFVGWKALFARTGWALRATRIALAPLVAPALGLVLARRRSLVALELFLLGAVLPRTLGNVGGRATVAVVAVALAVGWLWVTRRPIDDTARRHWELAEPWALSGCGFAALVCVGAIALPEAPVRNLAPDFDRGEAGVWPYVAPVVVVMAGIWITWFWAQLRWRAIVAALGGMVIATWVAVGGHSATVSEWPIGGAVNAFGSLWWAIPALAIVTTAIGYNIPIRRPASVVHLHH
jgi:patatin-related protein